jgi:hypothetical protein
MSKAPTFDEWQKKFLEERRKQAKEPFCRECGHYKSLHCTECGKCKECEAGECNGLDEWEMPSK